LSNEGKIEGNKRRCYHFAMRIEAAMLYVKDLPNMAVFYENSLGVKPITRTRAANWMEFEAGGFAFLLHAIPPERASGIQIASPPQAREDNPLKLVFEVEDVAAEVSRLEAIGIAILRRPWGTFDGIDPEGNIFQITSSQS
jgi:predicted enzyme related to lactoylglutathione lyase